jgi:4-oxalocrotonate tautomerase
MPLIQVKVEEASTPTGEKKIVSNLTDATDSFERADMCFVTWVDLEEVLNDEWEIGGLAMTTEAIRALVAGE